MIEIKNLTKTYQDKNGRVDALSDINLSIEDGDIYGIIGLSGAGKSTLVRCMNLLEVPTSGEVWVDGKNLQTLSAAELRKERRDITMIFQQFNLLMQKNCLKNICYPMEISGVKKKDAQQKARELLKLVGLEEKEKAYPAQLSGGQKQRIAIARALATNPKVLLCDEATSALDPITTHSILELLKEINQKFGITIVIITHQMSVVEEICRHVTILDNGHVVEQGEVGKVFSAPQSETAKRLVYPAGVLGDGEETRKHVYRIAFNGTYTTNEPIIAKLAAEHGVIVSILGADTRNINGQAFGTMLIQLPEDDDKREKALSYLHSYEGITVEEVHGNE